VQNVKELLGELKNAKLVNKDNFPSDVVRLNSRVKIKDVNKGKVMDLTLVTPDKADIRERKISVMAPVGTALIGFKKGQKINWQVPAGRRTFTIMEVIN
jgi:regulator of nucleoside diphosphate kinase